MCAWFEFSFGSWFIDPTPIAQLVSRTLFDRATSEPACSFLRFTVYWTRSTNFMLFMWKPFSWVFYSMQSLFLQPFFKTLTKHIRKESRANPGKIWSRDPSGKKFFEFCFLKWRILVHFIFLSDGGAPNVAGPRENFFLLLEGLHIRCGFLLLSVFYLNDRFATIFSAPQFARFLSNFVRINADTCVFLLSAAKINLRLDSLSPLEGIGLCGSHNRDDSSTNDVLYHHLLRQQGSTSQSYIHCTVKTHKQTCNITF